MDQQPLDYNKHCTITFGAFVQAKMTKIQRIQMFCGKLTAFTYYHWIKYKVDIVYLIYTVTELLQDGRSFKFQFMRK